MEGKFDLKPEEEEGQGKKLQGRRGYEKEVVCSEPMILKE